jgi:hypothetical protein
MRSLLPHVAATRLLVALTGVGLMISPVAHAAGSLSVRSDVPGQAIFLDGVDIGLNTPASIPGIPAGPHTLRVVGDCRVGETKVNVMDDRDLPLSVNTRPTPGSIALKMTPPGGDVRIDGKPVTLGAGGTAPVSCGSHTVAVSLSDHLPMMLNVEVQAGQVLNLPLTLSPLGRGQLDLDVTPDSAVVLLDGLELGSGDQQALMLVAGPHMLRVEAEGHGAAERQFVVDNGGQLSLSVVLLADPNAVAVAPAKPFSTGPSPSEGGLNWSKGKIAGVSLTTVGVGVGVVAAVQLARMGQMGTVYQERADEVIATNDASVLAPSYADNYRDDELIPQRNRAVTTSLLATAFLATGITLSVAF